MQDESRRGRDLIYVNGSNQINAVQYKWREMIGEWGSRVYSFSIYTHLIWMSRQRILEVCYFFYLSLSNFVSFLICESIPVTVNNRKYLWILLYSGIVRFSFWCKENWVWYPIHPIYAAIFRLKLEFLFWQKFLFTKPLDQHQFYDLIRRNRSELIRLSTKNSIHKIVRQVNLRLEIRLVQQLLLVYWNCRFYECNR